MSIGGFLSRIVSEYHEVVGLGNGLTTYVLLLTVLLTPLMPFNILVSIGLVIYVFRRIGFKSLFMSILLAYMVLSIIGYGLVGFLLLSMYLFSLMIFSKRYLLLIGGISVCVVTYYVLGMSVSINEYYAGLRSYVSGTDYEVLGIHVVLLSFITVYSVMNIPFLRASRIGKYLVENPGAYPVIQFMVLLIYAAILLALNHEGLANKAAELAYYSLVIGVVLSIVDVVREEKVEENK